VLSLAFGLGLQAVVGCRPAGGAAKGGGPPAPVVEALVVQPEVVVERARFVGQLDAADQVVIKPEISGIVAEIGFHEGQPVRAGDPLLRLRDGEQRARLAEARARLSLAEDEFERAASLRSRGASSEAELERARAQRDIARAQLDLAKVQLERTVIRAPFDGVMDERLVSPGERVSPGGGDFGSSSPTGLARIVSLDRMELRFTVPEGVVAALRPGLPMRIRVAAWPEEVFPGQVFFVAPRVDERNRRLLVKASVPNPEHKLRPGMFAHVSMKVREHPAALMIPEDAVTYTREGTAVWRIRKDGTAESVPVELGLRQEGRVLVSGLAAGDRIVVSGTHKVSEGKPVEVRTAGGASPGLPVGSAHGGEESGGDSGERDS